MADQDHPFGFTDLPWSFSGGSARVQESPRSIEGANLGSQIVQHIDLAVRACFPGIRIEFPGVSPHLVRQRIRKP